MKWLVLTAFVAALSACSGMGGSSTSSSTSNRNPNDMTYRGGSQ